VRIYTRRGADWTHRFSRIVEGVRKLRLGSVLLDGEGVVCDDNGLAIFDRLHSKANDESVFLYAFDLLELDGDDWRRRPLGERKSQLQRLLARTAHGIHYNDTSRTAAGSFFEKACKFGCEGIVAKRIDSPYRSGRSKTWIKVKNPNSPAALRIEDGTF
jgi:ATP-dependent DNA ligase